MFEIFIAVADLRKKNQKLLCADTYKAIKAQFFAKTPIGSVQNSHFCALQAPKIGKI